MNRNVMISALVVGLIVGAGASSQTEPLQKGAPKGGSGKGGIAAGSPLRPAWEYKAVQLTFDTEGLNKLGAEGWELVAIDTMPKNQSLYVFKRPATARFAGKKEKGFFEKKDFDPPKRGEPEPKKGFGSGFGTTGGPGGFGSTGTTGTFGRGGSSTSTTSASGSTTKSTDAPAKRDIRVIPLKNANAIELMKVVRPFVNPDAVIAPDPRTNVLIIACDPATFEDLQRLVIVLDEPVRNK